MKRTPLRKISKKRQKQLPREKRWYNAVMTKDNWICQACGKMADDAHHLLGKGAYPEYRFILENGIALCRECHSRAHFLNGLNWLCDPDVLKQEFIRGVGTVID